ncbi:hypothetical protein ADT27_13450 [Xanthomonas oryzae]|uniref:hypothetical protein n=1 Tax=Xanthomonas oryzae TaxID=347 RepID=UPI0006AC3FE4|nr:hypothetical protein [Xanthomonas oryzae]KOR44995.1 hypothetical protein ADT27_13450 [Xanthomonas oryzae]
MLKSDLRNIFIIKIRDMVEKNPDIAATLGTYQQDRYAAQAHLVPHEGVLDVMEMAYNMGMKNANFDGVF